ncbi:MAG: 16S rRNA (adenine(1518)-N(6)/adenine(1519)-N(6))-dimethyltransferase RsmA [Acidobacteriia bacterium]|nr:16S rRNA (adenine(1518)-N(6)/adenine(1519)-N(6))-dimethyltransferase RsmA [Terriglobia bacterium]
MTATRPRARKRFGQNFLEPAWVTKVIRAIAPRAGETFIEIGPGRGALTRPLASQAARVIAYEIDRDLAAELRASGLPNVTVIEGDFLETSVDLPATSHQPPDTLRVAGNLPYNVASPILFTLADLYAQGCPIIDATVMLQREVGDRLIAAPGSREYGVLSVLMQHSASVERLLALPPGAFRPQPKVHSVLVRLTFHPPAPAVLDHAIFVHLVQAVFTRRRKTLANALLAYPGSGAKGTPALPAEALRRAGLDGTRRPETLSVAEFARLADIYASISP